MCHLLAAYWNLSPTWCMLATDNTEFHLDMHTTVPYIVSSEQARCSRKWQNTDFDNRNPLRMRKGVS